MGCWNKTCAISNLHINYEDPVYVFIIQQQSLGSTHCDSTHLYQPILVPFYAEYDYYGEGTNISGVAAPIIFECLKHQLIEKEVGENQYSDPEVKRDNLTMDNLFGLMRNRRICIKNSYYERFGGPEELVVEFVMMRKDIVDKILNEFKFDYFDENYKTIKIGFSDVIKDVDFVINSIQEYFWSDDSMFRFHGPLSYSEEIWPVNSKMAGFFRCFNSINFSGIVNIVKVIYEFVENGKLEEAKEFLIDALKGAYINKFMELTRRSWIPTCGEGSQNTDPDGHLFLAQAVIQVLQKEKEELDYWD